MKIIIGNEEKDQRFDRFLRKFFKKKPEIKLADIYSWIRKGTIKLNGKKAREDHKVELGDEITFTKNQNEDKNPLNLMVKKDQKVQDINIDKIRKRIIHEDKNRIFFDKPAGIVAHPGNDHLDDLTMNDYLEQYIAVTQKSKSATFKPSFCFRLDRDTSGILIAAKNFEALQYLNELIRDRKTNKTYLCIVKGLFPKKVEIDEPIFRGFNKKFGRAQSFVNREMGLEAKSSAKFIDTITDKYLGNISLVEVKIFTGRMHQIRVHLSHIGYPILGDMMYGDDDINKQLHSKYKIQRQLLHSLRYSFTDKFTNKTLEVQSEVPSDFRKLFSDGNFKL